MEAVVTRSVPTPPSSSLSYAATETAAEPSATVVFIPASTWTRTDWPATYSTGNANWNRPYCVVVAALESLLTRYGDSVPNVSPSRARSSAAAVDGSRLDRLS